MPKTAILKPTPNGHSQMSSVHVTRDKRKSRGAADGDGMQTLIVTAVAIVSDPHSPACEIAV